MEKQKKSNVFYKIITFPEKLSTLFIYLFVIILTAIDVLVVVLLVPKVDYSYIPTYEEKTEYDWMNPYIRSITGYYEGDEGEVYSSMTVTFCYFGIDTNHKATKTLGSFTIIDDKGEIHYAGDLAKSTSVSYSTTSTPLSRLSKNLTGIKTIYGKVEYDKMFGGENQGSDVLLFREDMIALTKNELKDVTYGIEDEIKAIFDKYEISVEKDSDKVKIINKIDFVASPDYKYHFDYQLFGVDEKGNTYDLIGIYNFSNNYSRYLSLDTKVPEQMSFSYYVSVFKIKINGEEKVIYLRKSA